MARFFSGLYSTYFQIRKSSPHCAHWVGTMLRTWAVSLWERERCSFLRVGEVLTRHMVWTAESVLYFPMPPSRVFVQFTNWTTIHGGSLIGFYSHVQLGPRRGGLFVRIWGLSLSLPAHRWGQWAWIILMRVDEGVVGWIVAPQKICPSSNPGNLWMWPFVEKRFLRWSYNLRILRWNHLDCLGGP